MSTAPEIVRAQDRVWHLFSSGVIPRKHWPRHLVSGAQLAYIMEFGIPAHELQWLKGEWPPPSRPTPMNPPTSSELLARHEAMDRALAAACPLTAVLGDSYPLWTHRCELDGFPSLFQPSTDLNAAHAALLELVVGNDHREFVYRTALETVCGHDYALIPFADAAQVSEAVLRTIGKWADVGGPRT